MIFLLSENKLRTLRENYLLCMKLHSERENLFNLFQNGFEKNKNFITYWLKAFLSDTPQSIKCQNKGPKEHNEM